MKMAENQLISLSNNCESINRNCVEVEENIVQVKNVPQTIFMISNIQTDTLPNSSDICTQEEAVEEFLAGDNSEYNNELLSNMENDDEEILFKTDNVLECGDGEYGHESKKCSRKNFTGRAFHRNLEKNYIAKVLKKRSIKCLNKMQIMEDVREGCNVQPSSPGHADQGSGDVQVKSEIENGDNEDQKPETINEDKDAQKEDTKDSNIEEEPTESKEINEENYSNTSSPNAESCKRKSDGEEPPVKRLRTEIQENFISRDKILNEFIEIAGCNHLEQIQMFSEQLLAEVKTLNELAREKEREWNNIVHLKKLKEELLLRMQRKRQLLLLNEKTDYSELLNESQDNQDKRLEYNIPQSILKTNLMSPKSSLRIPNVGMNGDRIKQRHILPRPPSSIDFNGSLDFRQKQRPTLDVQAIIADYRQRHPESIPRRGRRIRTSQNDGSNKSSGSVLNFSSMALGSGAQVMQNMSGQDVNNELGLLLNTINMNRAEGVKLPADSSGPSEDAVSFKDMLQKFAKLSQSERNELIQNAIKPPPPYPEVTVLPVPTTSVTPTNSLLHGILTKSPTTKQNNSKTSFSPTLARLLTAPERTSNNHTSSHMNPNSTVHFSNMSISEILSSSKARNEITITPVESQYETSKGAEEEEAEDSADRLVIDESSEAIDARKSASADNSSDNGDEIPQCQGCNQKPAQFVCAGCGNQWYCSRDCQVSAWDEHSEICSG